MMYNPFLFANGNKGPYILRDAFLPVFFLTAARPWGLMISGPMMFTVYGMLVILLTIYFRFVKGKEATLYGVSTLFYGIGLLLLALAGKFYA